MLWRCCGWRVWISALISVLISVLMLPVSVEAYAGGFAPIPVDVVWLPQQFRGSVDQELLRGQVRHEVFSMARPARKVWRIAYLFPHLNDPYWLGCAYGVINEARRLRVAIDIIPADGYDDLVGQLRDMNQAVAAKYDAIVVSPISLSGDNVAIEQARRAGIPVFELANDSTSHDLVSKVTTSMTDMGVNAARWMVADAQTRKLKTVTVALLPGPAHAGWVQGEVNGTLQAIRQSPVSVRVVAIRYGDSDRVIQTQLAAQVLAQYGRHLDYILGCTGCAPAAVLPIREAHLDSRIRVIAYDLTDEIAVMLRRGEIVAAGDTKGVSQARIVTDLVVDYLEKRRRHLPDTVLVSLGMVDARHVGAYLMGASIAPQNYTPVLSWSPNKSNGGHPPDMGHSP